jgi:hypothetical protein
MSINQPQQMIFRNLIFEAKVVKQRFLAGLVSHHEQQASECEDKQQHRELWPAYYPNLAPPQASTQGLFQQTRLFPNQRENFEVILLDDKKGPQWIRWSSKSFEQTHCGQSALR